VPPLDAAVPTSTQRWRLTGTVGPLTLASYQWQEHVDALKLIEPCTGAVTIMVTTAGTPGKLAGRPTMTCYGVDAKAAKDALRAAWEAIGPWQLATPTETLTVCADPAAQDYEAVNAGAYWQVAYSWQEV
jgi:hypothetical protein